VLGRLQSLQDICIFDVDVDGDGVRLDFFGGPSRVCGSLQLSFDDGDAESRLSLLRQWQRDGTPLTLVSSDSQVALTDDAALVATAIDVPVRD